MKCSGTVVAATAIFVLAAGVALQGCVAVNAAAAVSRATIGSVNAVGSGVTRSVNAASNAVVRTVSRVPAALASRTVPRRIVVPARSTATRRLSAPRPQPVVTRSTPEQKQAARKKNSKQRDEILEVLPPELLNQLSDDQLILQAMIQADALEGPGAEVVFWELDGRAGTAAADAPHRMGGFTCRLVTETLKMAEADTEATEAKATACRTETTSWTLSF